MNPDFNFFPGKTRDPYEQPNIFLSNSLVRILWNTILTLLTRSDQWPWNQELNLSDLQIFWEFAHSKYQGNNPASISDALKTVHPHRHTYSQRSPSPSSQRPGRVYKYPHGRNSKRSGLWHTSWQENWSRKATLPASHQVKGVSSGTGMQIKRPSWLTFP